jgi:hypothetical protein
METMHRKVARAKKNDGCLTSSLNKTASSLIVQPVFSQKWTNLWNVFCFDYSKRFICLKMALSLE